MGVCGSKALDEETQANKRISRAQQDAAAKNKAQFKILLLGTGDSGKTTLRKQMRSVYSAPFSQSEREGMAAVVKANLVEGVLAVVRAMYNLLLASFSNERARKAADQLLELNQPVELTSAVAALIKILLEDSDFQQAVEQRSKYQLQDCWDAFAKNFLAIYPRWGSGEWLPSQEECVAVRVRTSGIVEERLRIGKADYIIFDVGGQRAERRKWIHGFEKVNAIIFVTAISEYDLTLFEDSRKNRALEAFDLFGEIANSSYFENTPIMLFLNKRDLFEKKFLEQKIPLNISGLFPDAPTYEQGMPAVQAWFESKFEERKGLKTGTLYTHLTNALDPANVKLVVDDITHIIIQLSLAKSGFTSGV